MPIMQYTGKILLDPQTVGIIQKEAAALVANKDVAGAYAASRHLKRELSGIPKEDVSAVLPSYRAISGSLKALALPVLSEEDVSALLSNNLEFLDTKSEPLLVSGLLAWLASQPDDARAEYKKKFREGIDRDSAFAPKLLEALKDDAPLPGQTVYAPPSAAAPKDAEADSLSRTIFSLSGASVSEEAFVKRATALVRSRLRDVRTAAEFAEYAGRPFAAGGLGLANDALERAEAVVEGAYGRKHSALPAREYAQAASTLPGGGNASVVPKATRPPSASTPPVLKSAQTELDALITQGAADASIESILKGKTQAASALPGSTQPSAKPGRPPLPRPAAGSSQLPAVSVVTPARPKPPIPGASAQFFQTPLAAPSSSRPQHNPSAVSGKARMQDVRASAPVLSEPALQSKVTGLADSLATITIGDFRGFGSSGQAQQLLLGKIATLEGESLSHKADGMRSLRLSPLFKAYLSIGDAALAGGKKLSEALADPSINSDNMTEDEFFAIADLASKLK